MLLILLFFSSSFLKASMTPLLEKAQAHSLVAASLLNDALFSNPASASLSTHYAVDATYFLPKSFSVSILDTRTSTIGGGLAYHRQSVDYSERPTQGIRLGLMGLPHRDLGIGITGKALWGDGFTFEGTQKIPKASTHQDIDIGLLTRLGLVQLGLVSKNILGGKTELEEDREISIGANINYEQLLFLSVASHSKWDRLNPYQYSMGAEYVSPYYFSLKGGFRIQPENKDSFWGVGAGVHSPKISIQYAMEIPQQEKDTTSHVLGATLLF